MDARARKALEAALPSYEIGERLGRGAFGVVWAARHSQLGRDVAIKQLPQAFVIDETIRGRFVDEARTVASLDHPHIVPVYDFVENSDVCLLVMERCADSVGDRFKADGIATDEACAAVLACLAALHHAHDRGVLHRDVKPENLMYDMTGTVKLADFGIARVLDHDVRRTATGMVVGTPAYMSPEQVRGEQLGEASDVYSVAVMAYELLTGALPFPESESVTGLLAHHLVTDPSPMLSTRPELPGVIGTVIDRALTKDLDVRHATALDFATDLSRACVTAFGSGWLRRRRFTLHWPDIVAENERNGPESPRTGTIVVQAHDVPHDVITPSAALAGDIVAPIAPPSATPTSAPSPSPVTAAPVAPASTTPPPATSPASTSPPVPAAAPPPAATPSPPVSTSAPPAPVVGPSTAPAPASSTPSVPPPGSAGGPPPSGAHAPSSSNRGRSVMLAVVAAVVLIVGVGVAFVATRGDDTESSAGTNADETDPDVDTEAGSDDDDGQPALSDDATVTPIDDTDTGVDSPDAGDDSSPESDEPATDTGGSTIVGPPDDYVASDASEFLAPTPCPTEPARVACIWAGVTSNTETGSLSFGYFTDGFVPDIAGGGDRVHFYFDTAVDGDENAAGTAGVEGSWVEWDGPPLAVMGDDLPAGLELLTVADAEAVDARHLCAIVADAAGVAQPGTGNCAPIVQVWDQPTLATQVDRLSGRWLGGCGTGASVIVPDGWRHVDLTTTSPAEAAGELFPANVDAVTTVFEQFVDAGALIYAVGPVTDLAGAEVTVLLSQVSGDVTLTSSPAQTDAAFIAAGRSVEPSLSKLINDRQIATTTTDDGTTVTARYRVPDFGSVFELSVSAASGSDLAAFGDRVAATVVGC